MNINESNLNRFIQDKDIPLDEIFSEINALYDIPIALKEDTPPQPTPTTQPQSKEELQKEIAAMKAAYVAEFEKYKKISSERQLTPEEVEHLRTMEMQLAKKLEEEAIRIQKDMRDPQVIQQIQQNPQAYAQQHQVSMSTVPQQQRAIMAPSPNNSSAASQMVGQAAMQSFGMLKGMLFNQIIYFGIFGKVTAAIIGVMTLAWGKLSNLLVGSAGSDITVQTAYKQAFIHKNGGGTIKLDVINRTDESGNLIGQAFVNPMTKEVVSPSELSQYNPGTVLKDITMDDDNNYLQQVKSTDQGLIGKMTGISNESFGGYGQYAKWGILAVILSFIAYLIYKYINRKVIDNKKKEYAEMKNTPVSEVTIPMLCEYDENNFDYFAKMHVLDEGMIGDFFSKLLPSKESFRSKIISGMDNVKGLIASSYEYLRDSVGHPAVAKFALRVAGWCCVILPIGVAAFTQNNK